MVSGVVFVPFPRLNVIVTIGLQLTFCLMLTVRLLLHQLLLLRRVNVQATVATVHVGVAILHCHYVSSHNSYASAS